MYNTTHTDTYLPADNGPITNPQEITNIMEADAAKDNKPTNPGPEPHPYADTMSAIFDAVLTLMTPHIERMVEKKFAQLVQNHNTLTHMDANLEDKMREIADAAIEDKISEHENDWDHNTESGLQEAVEQFVDNHLRGNDDIMTERRVEEMIDDAIRNHTYEEEHLGENDIDSKLEDFISTDNIEEYVIEALKKVEFKIDVTEKE